MSEFDSDTSMSGTEGSDTGAGGNKKTEKKKLFFMDASGTLQFHPRKIFFDQAYTFMSVDSPSTAFSSFYITDISTNPHQTPATFESQLGVLQNDAERWFCLFSLKIE